MLLTAPSFAKIKSLYDLHNTNIEDRGEKPNELADRIKAGESFNQEEYLLASREFGVVVAQAMLVQKPYYLGSQSKISGRTDLALWLRNAGSIEELSSIKQIATATLWKKKNKKGADALMQFVDDDHEDYSNFRDGEDREAKNDALSKACLALALENTLELTMTKEGDTVAHILATGRLKNKIWAYQMIAEKWPNIFTVPNKKFLLPIHGIIKSSISSRDKFNIAKAVAEIMQPGNAKAVFDAPYPGALPLYAFAAQQSLDWQIITEILSIGCDFSYLEILDIILQSKSNFHVWVDSQNLAEADLQTADQHGRTILHRAVLAGHSAMVMMLAKLKKLDFSAQDKSGNTALHLALIAKISAYERERIVKILLENGTDVNVANNDQKLAIDYAMELLNKKILIKASVIAQLIEKGSKKAEEAVEAFNNRYPLKWYLFPTNKEKRLEARISLRQALSSAKATNNPFSLERQ